MRDKSLINRYEPWFLVGTATIYVIRRLIEEINQFNDIVGSATGNGVSPDVFWQDLTGYHHTLNNNVPLIASVCLFLVAWYVFHNLSYPNLFNRSTQQKGIVYGLVAGLLLLAAVVVYYYLKLHIEYRVNEVGKIIGLKVYSLYRKRTILADAIGLGIMLGTYELAYQYYQFLYRRIAQETTIHFRLVSYLLMGGVVLFAIAFALNGRVPPTLWHWHGSMQNVLLFLGLLIQVMFLQDCAYTHIFPMLKPPRSSETAIAVAGGAYVLVALGATTVVWGAKTEFYFVQSRIVLHAVYVLIASLVIAYLRWVLTSEKTVLQTQVSVKSAELSSLRAQINPHFLFNALNSLYATALKEKGEKTADGIQKLGDMMRFMLHENNRDRIPLDKEVEYLRNYIEIQRMRIDETHNIEIRVNIQEPNRAVYLAPMLLTPFVENAFKHGISLRHPSWIFITLTLDDTRLYFKVHNSRHAKPAEADRHDPEENQSGVGLDNVRKRLDLIYPGRHQLDIQQSEQDYFVSLMLVYW